MRRGVIYARYSCDKQTDNSIKGQVRECTLFAERNDIQIINVYADEAISGRTDKRPAFLRMFRDAAQHQFDVIVIWKTRETACIDLLSSRTAASYILRALPNWM